ncbi:RHS repeat-associated core domain-containing protein [Actinoplanes sp. TFC3]|uniref:RHS repeat-associated core domain-containing protein n=1 Tax=Actinoplanes sp. TFC3 TaxID=1710355 RepID=UPI000830FF81|nr:RHS repeat-associated core domain-containing protein [Actinoplanes sp. TFC3]
MTALAVIVSVTAAPAAEAAPASVTPVAAPQVKKRPCPADRPDEAAALTAARICGGEVKISGQTSEYDDGVALPNGQVRWEHHYRPVRVERGTSWAPVDTTLTAQPDGTVQPAATAVGLEFSGGGTGPMVKVTEAGTALTLGSPLGRLPKPVLQANVATYPEVLPGVDLQLKADVDGYAQVLVVKNRQAAANPKLAELTFPLAGTKLTVSTDSAGNLRATDAKGKVRLSGNAPLMWDASAQQSLTARPDAEPGSTGVTKKLTAALSKSQISVTPNRGLLDDPDTVYPVYIDPGVTATRSAWTKVSSANPTTSYWNAAGNAPVGGTNVSGAKYRSFFDLDISSTPIAGTHIVAANLVAVQAYALYCESYPVDLWATGYAGQATTWNNQPAFSGGVLASNTSLAGCTGHAGASLTFPVTAHVQSAANGAWTNLTYALRSDESATLHSYKEFGSNPYVSITYSRFATITSKGTLPATTCTTGANRPYVNTTTPTLRVRVTDPEGAGVRPEIEWDTPAGVKLGSAQPTPAATSGSLFGAAIPAGALTNGSTFSWKARGYDGNAWGPWSSPCELTVDTTAPTATPTVSSATYPANDWGGAAGSAGTFTLGAGGTSDIAAYVYTLDDDPAAVVNTSALGGTASISIVPDEEGKHTLKVQARDRAGNLSPARTYTFFAGTGAVSSPAAGTLTAGKVTLSGLGRSTSTGVTYQWRRGDADTWTTIPAGDVTTTAGAAISWPLATTGSGAYPELSWNVAQTVNNAEAGAEPLNGPVQVRASFSGTTGTSGGVLFTLDRDRVDAASSEIGPGQVNLLTGNFSASAADAGSIGGLSLQRTFNSRQAAVVDPMFGPGWTASAKAEQASTFNKLTVTGSLVQVGLADGSTLGFAKKATTSTGASFTPQIGSEDTTLTYTSTGNTYTLATKNGDVVTFTNQSAGVYVPAAVKSAGSATDSRISWETATVGGVAVVRPTQVTAHLPAGVTSCATIVKGCRVLGFTYATATTATAGAPGDYAGRVKQVSLSAWDPELATPGVRTVVLTRYDYDSTGRLHAAWNPALDYTSGAVTKHVATEYTYGTDGTLATLTPPGELPWQLTYTTVPGDTGAGRLYKASRAALPSGTSVQTVVYNVKVSGAGSPVDMASYINRWGQTVLPVDATAVYPQDIVPDGNPATGTLPSYSDDDRVTVTYMDSNGREIDTMLPGGTVEATWFDKYGNEVRTLDAGNLAEALWRTDSDSTEEEADYARRESTENVYSADGQRLLETFEPEHDVELPDSQTVRGRAHLVSTYDEGAPAGAAYDLVTSQTRGVQYTANGVTTDADKRTTTTAYDWTYRRPVATTVDPGGLALTTRTTYDSVTGQVASTTSPAGTAAGTTPATRKTVYYRAGTGSGYSECDNRAEWAELPCRVFTGGQPGGTELPVTSSTYDFFGQPRTVVERNSTATLRTSTVTYDAAGRESDTTITAAAGVALDRKHTGYDQVTGRPSVVQSVNAAGTVTGSGTTQYDTLGRQSSYTDADGATTTATFDLRSRPLTVTDGKGSQTYTYNNEAEKRGFATQLVDSQAGTFSAEYDDFGNLVSEGRPNGVGVRHYYDETGAETGVEYNTACDAGQCSLYSEYVDADVHGGRIWDYSSLAIFGYTYDKAGRVSNVRQDDTAGCTQRAYAFDTATNRTQRQTFAPGGDGTCQDTTATTRTWTYDSADRVTSPAPVIDALGRTTTVPAADLSTGSTSGDVQLTYYVNDLTRTMSNSAAQATYTIDPLTNRYRGYSVTAGGNTVAHTYHYSDDTDKPSWIAENGWYTRRVSGLNGVAAYVTGSDAHLEWQITNLHGDVVGLQTGSTAGLAATYPVDEFGKSLNGSAPRYGYLGDEQRSADNPGGLVSMGVRTYNPETGRFLSTDAVYGGNANAYDYCSGDAVNCTDTSGLMSCYKFNTTKKKNWAHITWLWHNWYRCKMSHQEVTNWLIGGSVPSILKDLLAKPHLVVVRWSAVMALVSIIGGFIYNHKCAKSRGIGWDYYSGYNFHSVFVFDIGISRMWCR